MRLLLANEESGEEEGGVRMLLRVFKMSESEVHFSYIVRYVKSILKCHEKLKFPQRKY